MADFIKTTQGLLNLDQVVRVYPASANGQLLIIMAMPHDHGSKITLHGAEARAVEAFLGNFMVAGNSEDFSRLNERTEADSVAEDAANWRHYTEAARACGFDSIGDAISAATAAKSGGKQS